MKLTTPIFILLCVWCFQGQSITKTYLYNFDPVKPHCLYSKTGVHRGIHYFSYFCSKHRLWELVRTASARWFYRVPTIIVLSRNMKKISELLSENFQFLMMKFSTDLNEYACFRYALNVLLAMPHLISFIPKCLDYPYIKISIEN